MVGPGAEPNGTRSLALERQNLYLPQFFSSLFPFRPIASHLGEPGT